MRKAEHGCAGVVLVCLLLFAACSGGAPTAYRAPAGTPVVIVSIDTLRSDHLPAYGYRGVETPAIDALRRDGLLFERAYSHVPLTLPSHTSMFTGLLPARHGVRDNVGYLLDAAKIEDGSLPFLPQLLKSQGYATGAAVSAFVLRAKTGFATGFDLYDDAIEFKTAVGLGGLQRSGADTLRAAEPWLGAVAGKPFFLFLHLYDPHTPYQPPEPFASRYASKYDGEIAAADRVLGDLTAELTRLGVYDEALIILTSDHGEGLGEHGEDEHGLLLYRETLQVPLVVKLPGQAFAGRSVAASAQLADVMPTVLSVLGLPVPEGLAGASLLSLLGESPPERQIISETFYPRLHFGWSDLASMIEGRHHFIEAPEPELYDLAADPRSLENILLRDRRAAGELRRALAAYERALKGPGDVDQETKAALAALGYLGGTVAAGDGPLPDPKKEIGSLAEFKVAVGLQSRKQYREAAAAYRRVVARNPRLVDAWEFLGRTLERLGQDDEALAAYKKALEVSGGSPQVALTAASLYLRLGALSEAEQHARLALASHASFAHGLLAQVALARKDTAAAEREARAALAAGENRLGPLITLAGVLHGKGAYEEALSTLSEAERVYADRKSRDKDLIQGLELVRGKALADLGQTAEAERAFLAEIEGYPDDSRAYANLALLLALSGRGAEVGPTLKRMVEANPSAATYAEAVKTLRVLEDPAAAAALLRYARSLHPESQLLRTLG